MKRLTCFSVLGSYSIGFELEHETTVPAFIEKLRSAGVSIDRVKLREKAEKAENTARAVHGREYSAAELIKSFDEINAAAEDIVYNIRCKKGKKTFSVFMKGSTSKVSVLTEDFYFDLEKALESGEGR